MQNPEYAIDNLLDQTITAARNSVKTQYACQVVAVSSDGRFVDVAHNTLEWRACPNGEAVMRNSYNRNVVCSPVKPWIIQDVPVEETYERGQWKVRARPKVGDRGILSVFYHDISSLKEKGGFQAPTAIRVMAIDSASFRPGLPNHADVNAETDAYPDDNEWELKGNGVSIKLTSPADETSDSPNKMEVNIGNVSFTVTVPQNGDPTVVFNVPDGSVNVTSKTATVTADCTINGDLEVTGNIIATGTIEGAGVKDTTDPLGVTLGTHTHGAPTPVTPAPTPGS